MAYEGAFVREKSSIEKTKSKEPIHIEDTDEKPNIKKIENILEEE